ncbi:hypothetical protein DAETH_09550 [Deinococcus aetherius]|uniref:Uncharacterized protein n=1 Tax=Deinococcus aetherius TaxID=200252 RepID=A0ABM8AB57_9DEIO|nr:hypothetical protein [Deinococcus aetherius]BDP40986.1 hypothetical protein DAETH_09550 [Deinococcus aetherius]
MSGFSGGSFSFSHSGGRHGAFRRRSHSSGRRGGFLGGALGHSHSSGHRGHYAGGGHYRQTRRRGGLGCLGAFLAGAALTGGSLAGLLTLLA